MPSGTHQPLAGVLHVVFQHDGDQSAHVARFLQLRLGSHALVTAAAPGAGVILCIQIEELNVTSPRIPRTRGWWSSRCRWCH